MQAPPPQPYPLNTTIAVLAGGRSSERAVSLRSGTNCLAALHRLGYSNAVLVDADATLTQQLLDLKPGVAFLALHGAYGEDGCVQGLLEWLDIPYTGNRVTASATGMNKHLTKAILKEAGLPILASQRITHTDNATVIRERCKQWQHYPVMVKPANGGSSVGMSKVDEPDLLLSAIQLALSVDTDVMLEAFVKGVDATVGIVDINGTPTVTPVLELRPKTGWYDETAKYTAGLTEFILPATFTDELTHTLQQLSLQAHQAMGCHGLSRVDFVVDPTANTAHILEINTMPGMTDLSDLPAQAATMGIDYDTLVAHILASAATAQAAAAPATSTPNAPQPAC